MPFVLALVNTLMPPDREYGFRGVGARLLGVLGDTWDRLEVATLRIEQLVVAAQG